MVTVRVLVRMAGAGALALLAACNLVLSLDETRPEGPPPPDRDDDGVADLADNCPITPNPDQADRDDDGFGDACDTCKALNTADNHDEDGDLQGDACDACPAVSAFPVDIDQDGIGDACDNDTGAPSTLVAFDPFLSLDPAWTTTGIAWEPRGDAIAPVAPLDVADPGLRNANVVVGGTIWRIDVGALAERRPSSSDAFGVAIYDTGGSRVAGCKFSCADTCSLEPILAGVPPNPVFGYEPQPGMFMTVRVKTTRLMFTQTVLECIVDAGSSTYTSSVTAMGLVPTSGAVALFGSPIIKLTFVSVVD